MPTFYIKHGITGSDRDTWEFVCDRDGNPLEYSDGKSAALAKDCLAAPGERRYWRIPEAHSLFIYREPGEGEGDLQWREREAGRFASGRYKPLPWADDPDMIMPPDHFAHVSENNPQKVAFTESEAKGRMDRQKVMSADDYLAAFVTSDYDKRAYYVSLMYGLSANVEFVGTSDEIEAVYLEMTGYKSNPRESNYGGVCSCMTFPADFFGGVHPVRTYGAGDLSLAFIRSPESEGGDESGRIIARALVWPERQICGRVYGPGASTLRGALRSKGYSRFDDCALVGARMLAIPHPNGDANCYVMPYIDGHHYFAWHDDEKHFVISDHGFEAANTGGYAYTYNSCECERCGDACRESEMREVDGEMWCGDCFHSYARTCDHCDETSAHDHSDVIVGSYRSRYGSIAHNYETWCENCVGSEATYSEAHSHYIADGEGETCDHCSEFFLPDELRTDDDDLRLCADCFPEVHPDDGNDDGDDDAPAAPVDAPLTTITLRGFEAAPAE